MRTLIESFPFNTAPPTIMHVDLNSCFASIEQQSKRHLRNVPIGVAAYTTPAGCVLAPSIEAKQYGVKVGMRVYECRELCPAIRILPVDAQKYRYVHALFKKLFASYSDRVRPKSIDEFVIDFSNTQTLKKQNLHEVALEIKTRIKREVGDWLRVNVGIATNGFLAKTAASLHKPDGLDEIHKNNYEKIFGEMKLTDLCGISTGYSGRLFNAGIFTPMDMISATRSKLKSAFKSVEGHRWFFRLRGWEVDQVEFGRKSYGNSYSLPKPLSTVEELSPILTKLTQKAGRRLRASGYKTRGIHLMVSYRDGDYWHHSMKLEQDIFDSRDIFRYAHRLLCSTPQKKPVRVLAVACFNITDYKCTQLELFEDVFEKESLSESLDAINERWGDYTIMPATMMSAGNAVPDRVPFGASKEIEDFAFEEAVMYQGV